MNKLPIIVLDFSGVYDFEAFASSRNIIRVDCKDLKGVDCYCDEDGREKLHRRLAPYPSKAIHFLDSGDFHYLTEYWVSRLQEPFSLIVFDHHPDMQQPQWEGLVSCGGLFYFIIFTKKCHEYIKISIPTPLNSIKMTTFAP